MIDTIVRETVEEILSGRREDGHNGKLPLQAEQAARQVLSYYDLRSPTFVGRLLEESVALETGDQVIGDWSKFIRMSLVDFIAAAAKRRMDSDEDLPSYQPLIRERLEALSPTRT